MEQWRSQSLVIARTIVLIKCRHPQLDLHLINKHKAYLYPATDNIGEIFYFNFQLMGGDCNLFLGFYNSPMGDRFG